jgi:peptide/nickel transport system substrate-binding protein
MRLYLKFFLLVILLLSSFPVHAASNQTLKIGINNDLDLINPFVTKSTFSANLLELVYDPLININEKGEALPLIAENWQASSDQTKWTFELRKNIYFHDGKPLTAKDVEFTFQTLKSMGGSINAFSLENILSIKIASPTKVEFQLKSPDQTFLQTIRRTYIAPAHLFGNNGLPLNEAYLAKPIGSGAFTVKELTKEAATLTSYPIYYRGKPKLNEIHVKVYSNEKILLSDLINENLDLTFTDEASYLNLINNIEYLKVRSYHQFLYSVFLNLKNPFFKEKEIRQALNLAINKKMVKQLSKVNDEMAVSVTPPRSYTYKKQEIYPYNGQEALQKIKKQGWQTTKSGKLKQGNKEFVFDLLVSKGDKLSQELAKIIQLNLNEIGIQTRVKLLELAEVIKLVFNKKDFDAAILFYTSLNPIEMDVLYWGNTQNKGFNFTSYDNAKAREYLEKAKYASNKENSMTSYHRFQEIIHEDPPMIYLFWKDVPIVQHKRVKGLQSNPFFLFKEMNQVWIDENNDV